MMFTALGGPNWVALLAIVFANVVLALQIISSRALWNAMMSSDTLQAAA